VLAKQIDIFYSKLALNFYRNLTKYQKNSEVHSLSTTDLTTLEVIYLLGNPTYKEVTDFLGLTIPNANYRISKLIDKGFLIRTQDETDKRRFFLSVTDKYMDYYCVNDNFIEEIEKRAKKCFSKAEFNEFERLFDILINDVME